MSQLPSDYMHGSFKRGLTIFVIALIITIFAGSNIYKLFQKADDNNKTNVNHSSTQSISSKNSVNMPSSSPMIEESTSNISSARSSMSSSSQESSISSSLSSATLSSSAISSMESSISSSSLENLNIDVKTINTSLLAYAITNQSGEVILDLRSKTAYDTAHIRTSKNYSFSDFQIDDFVKTKSYTLICEDSICSEAQRIVQKLIKHVENVKVLQGGFASWEYITCSKDDVKEVCAGE